MPARQTVRLAFAALAAVPLAHASPSVPVTGDCLPPSASHGLRQAAPFDFATGLGTVMAANFPDLAFGTCAAPPSIGSDSESFAATVSLSGSVGGGSAVSDPIDGGSTWIPAQSDEPFAFTAPEPMSLLAIGLPVLGLGLAFRHRRQVTPLTLETPRAAYY